MKLGISLKCLSVCVWFVIICGSFNPNVELGSFVHGNRPTTARDELTDSCLFEEAKISCFRVSKSDRLHTFSPPRFDHYMSPKVVYALKTNCLHDSRPPTVHHSAPVSGRRETGQGYD